MSMKDLAMYHAMAVMSLNQEIYAPFMARPYRNPNGVSAYELQKLIGFTQVKGRKKLSKKKRKQLKSKKQ